MITRASEDILSPSDFLCHSLFYGIIFSMYQ